MQRFEKTTHTSLILHNPFGKKSEKPIHYSNILVVMYVLY